MKIITNQNELEKILRKGIKEITVINFCGVISGKNRTSGLKNANLKTLRKINLTGSFSGITIDDIHNITIRVFGDTYALITLTRCKNIIITIEDKSYAHILLNNCSLPDIQMEDKSDSTIKVVSFNSSPLIGSFDKTKPNEIPTSKLINKIIKLVKTKK